MLQVAAGILERQGRILICRRQARQAHPLKWEFPGGKVEAGETPEQALQRELEEELGIEAIACEEITRYEYAYPGKPPILLIFFRVTAFAGEPRNLIFAEIRWEPRRNLAEFDFLEGDLEFLRVYTGRMATALRFVDPKDNEFLASLEARTRQANPFFRAMAHRPEVLKNFPPLYSAIVGPGSVARRVKSLVYLACSLTNTCPFCIASNMPGARKAGITDEEIRALEAGEDGGFPPAERAAIAYARELTRTAHAETTSEELRAHYTDEQIVEITLVIGMSNFTNRFNNGLGILPE